MFFEQYVEQHELKKINHVFNFNIIKLNYAFDFNCIIQLHYHFIAFFVTFRCF